MVGFGEVGGGAMTDVVHTFRKFNPNVYSMERMVTWCGETYETAQHEHFTRGDDGNCEECEAAKALDLLARVP